MMKKKMMIYGLGIFLVLIAVISIFYIWRGDGFKYDGKQRSTHEESHAVSKEESEEKNEEESAGVIAFDGEENLAFMESGVKELEKEITAFFANAQKNGMYDNITSVSFFKTHVEAKDMVFVYCIADNPSESLFEARMLEATHFEIHFLGSLYNQTAVSDASGVQYALLMGREKEAKAGDILTDEDIKNYEDLKEGNSVKEKDYTDCLADNDVKPSAPDLTPVKINSYAGLEKKELTGKESYFEDKLLEYLVQVREPRREVEVSKKSILREDGKLYFICEFAKSRADGANVYVSYNEKADKFDFEIKK